MDRGIQLMMDIYNRGEKSYVPALLTICQGLIVTKQLQKARNQLKKIAEMARDEYNPQYANEFQRSWY